MTCPERKSALHVLMTADAVGGVWQYTLDLSKSLGEQGVRVTIAVLGPSPSPDQQATAEASGAELILTGLPLDWTARAPHEVEEASRAIARIATQIQPDLLHLNSPALAANATFDAPVVATCHSCVATWWQVVKGGPLPGEFVWRTKLVAEGYASADRLMAPTLAFAEATARTYDLPQIPTVVRNGRRSASVNRNTRGRNFIFTAGRLWDEGKNFAVIDRVASRLEAPVLAAGPVEGPNGAQVKADHARLLGRLSDGEVAQHLSAKPIFVSMARYEPFGLAVLEAAQMECALVLSNIPTFHELWEGAALFVDPSNENAIGDVLQQLLENPDARAVLGRAARERADAYTVDAMSAGVLAVYRSLLSHNSPGFSLEGAVA